MLNPDYQTPHRMGLKRAAIPLPRLDGKRVLDVGTDMGFWAFLAEDLKAKDVLGLDRNRDVRGVKTDLITENRSRAFARNSICRFEHIDIGKQWKTFGLFDLIFVMSVYHHIFQSAGGDHRPVWHWLWRHCAEDATVIFEGPVDDSDPVVRANVGSGFRPFFIPAVIMAAAEEFFDAEYVGPALHEPTRGVWLFKPKYLPNTTYSVVTQSGAGGAAQAFRYADNRRAGEISRALGILPVPGSLNVVCDKPFRWDRRYYRAEILDVVDRTAGFDSEWAPRWARFYPVTLDGIPAFAMRFEGDGYDDRFVELIADRQLRGAISTGTLEMAQ